MFRRILGTMLIILILSMTSVVFAAPEEFGADARGTVSGLIELSNSTGGEITTYEDSFIVAGSGKDGVIITLYLFDHASGMYRKFILNSNSGGNRDMSEWVKNSNYVVQQGDEYYVEGNEYVEGKIIRWRIGPSGLYIREIPLNEGENNLALYAEENVQNYEIVKFDITRLKKGFLMKIKDMSVDINKAVTGMFK